MLFTGLGTLLGYIIGEKVSNDAYQGVEWGFVSGIAVDILIAVIGGNIVPCVMESKNAERFVEIEKNIERSTNFSKFTKKAITVSTDGEKYYAEVIGMGLKEIGTKPDFVSVTYNIDKNLYDKLYGWDVDSILVMNPNCIEIVESES